MPKFQIEIEEILQRVEDIEAQTLEEAIDIVDEKYDNQEIVLDSEDFKGHEIREYSSTVKIEQIKKDAIIDINYGQAIILEGNKDLALIKHIGKEFEPYIIVTNIKPHQKYGTYFQWDNGSYFNSITEASKEYEKRANINKHFNDIDFSKIGEKTLENNFISKFNSTDKIFNFLMDDEINKEDLVNMLSDEMKEELILDHVDTVRKEGEEFFFGQDMWIFEEEINDKLLKIDSILQELKLDKVNPYEVIELLEQSENQEINPDLESKLLKEIVIATPDYNSSIENFIECVQERLEESQEELENE